MTDNAGLDNQKLFTLNGLIAVQFTDGEVLEGEFATQDAYNVFVTVDGEPRMIPRVQIRWIRGLQRQAIERDTSRQAVPDRLSTQPMPEATGAEAITEVRVPQPPAEETPPEELVVVEEAEPEPEIEADDAVIIEEPDAELAFAVDEETEAEEAGEGTLILGAGAIAQTQPEEDEEEDAGTLILVAGQEAEVEEVEGGTVVLSDSDEILAALSASAEPVEEAEEIDMTMVLGREVEIPEVLRDDELFAPQPSRPVATLTCISGPHEGTKFRVEPGITTMGRSTDNVVVLNGDKEISRRHAIILQEAGRYVVQDQNSLNGTFVNDEQITSPRYLQNGDVVMVGVSKLRFEEH